SRASAASPGLRLACTTGTLGPQIGVMVEILDGARVDAGSAIAPLTGVVSLPARRGPAVHLAILPDVHVVLSPAHVVAPTARCADQRDARRVAADATRAGPLVATFDRGRSPATVDVAALVGA